MKLCACGVCGLEVKEGNMFIHGHQRKGKTKENDESVKRAAEKHSIWMKNGGSTYVASFITEEGKKRRVEKRMGVTKENNENIKRAAEKQAERMRNGGAIHAVSFVTEESRRRHAENQSKVMKGRTKETHEGIKRTAEKTSIWMKEWGAAYLSSFNKNDSKPENELFILTCKALPHPIHKYPIYRGKGKRNYTVDIGDSSVGIALEYDGYYHFDTEEHREYHNKRQQEIEEDGWKFLRYNIFQKFPTLEQLKEDIKKLV